jgi:hypothetical protein
MPPRRKPRPGAEGELRQVVEDEGENDKSGPAHIPGGKGGLKPMIDFVGLPAPRPPICQRQGDRGPDVDHGAGEQDYPLNPKPGSEQVQELGIAVDPIRVFEDLQVADQMGADEQDQDNPGHRHEEFSADRGAKQIADDSHRQIRHKAGRKYAAFKSM